ncbi:hypothetical protein IGI04_029383 [Brassica rapa subsp. trilocularis]|uniref:Uncharacterized protein n=1 Tax=Brassica rapa subsp. trilocularis TaxID=1813537 RepID=A0ABQ7LMQ9_BRACM|nr:hypothetical protein IGI04_029383 [Brassica rapa subsp. trilocularis]
MLLVEYASSKEVIYIARTHILRSSLDCVYTGKLSLTTTPGSRFYFDIDIDIIQRFQKKNKLLY